MRKNLTGSSIKVAASFYIILQQNHSCCRTRHPPLPVFGEPPSPHRTQGALEAPSLAVGLQDNPAELAVEAVKAQCGLLGLPMLSRAAPAGPHEGSVPASSDAARPGLRARAVTGQTG